MGSFKIFQSEGFVSYSNATAGVMAAFFSTFTLCPTELVKCKLQALREVNVSSILLSLLYYYFNLYIIIVVH